MNQICNTITFVSGLVALLVFFFFVARCDNYNNAITNGLEQAVDPETGKVYWIKPKIEK